MDQPQKTNVRQCMGGILCPGVKCAKHHEAVTAFIKCPWPPGNLADSWERAGEIQRGAEQTGDEQTVATTARRVFDATDWPVGMLGGWREFLAVCLRVVDRYSDGAIENDLAVVTLVDAARDEAIAARSMDGIPF